MKTIFSLILFLTTQLATAATEPAWSVVAFIDRDATHVFDFQAGKLRKNPWSDRKGADRVGAETARRKACELSRQLGDQVWTVKPGIGRNEMGCVGRNCCGS